MLRGYRPIRHRPGSITNQDDRFQDWHRIAQSKDAVAYLKSIGIPLRCVTSEHRKEDYDAHKDYHYVEYDLACGIAASRDSVLAMLEPLREKLLPYADKAEAEERERFRAYDEEQRRKVGKIAEAIKTAEVPPCS